MCSDTSAIGSGFNLLGPFAISVFHSRCGGFSVKKFCDMAMKILILTCFNCSPEKRISSRAIHLIVKEQLRNKLILKT